MAFIEGVFDLAHLRGKIRHADHLFNELLVVVMSRVAAIEKKSGFVWGGLTLLICLASLLIPLPMIRVLIGGAVSFLIMLISNFMKK